MNKISKILAFFFNMIVCAAFLVYSAAHIHSRVLPDFMNVVMLIVAALTLMGSFVGLVVNLI